jgi:large repetitive protein
VAQVDAGGNISPRSPVYTITLDTEAPATPVITSGPAVTGYRILDTTDAQLTGTAEIDTRIQVWFEGTRTTEVGVDQTGNWEATGPALNLLNPSSVIRVISVDQAGNESFVDYVVTAS